MTSLLKHHTSLKYCLFKQSPVFSFFITLLHTVLLISCRILFMFTLFCYILSAFFWQLICNFISPYISWNLVYYLLNMCIPFHANTILYEFQDFHIRFPKIKMNTQSPEIQKNEKCFFLLFACVMSFIVLMKFIELYIHFLTCFNIV